MTTAILLVALVAEDPAVLRNAPRDDAPSQALLARGDWLEVRGETAGFLRVWDHRRERPGYVRPSLVRVHRVDADSALELRAVVRFLRDSTGNESLGIGYAALALRAAPAGADTTELLASIGTMADRLARRASARRADARDATLAAQLEVAESYGVRFKSADATGVGGRALVCYDGEAWERVLGAPSAPPLERARAALALAGEGCRTLPVAPAAERVWNQQRIQALGTFDLGALPASLAGRVRLRRAEALAWRSFDEARRGELEPAARDEGAAVRELALADRGVLAPEDLALHDDVAVRVAASRFAAEAPPRDKRADKRAVIVSVVPRAAGESCVRVVDGGGTAPRVLAERCTYGVVWQSALRWTAGGNLATLAVQPLPAWTELWVLRAAPPSSSSSSSPSSSPSWTIDVLTPATTDPEVGYVEAAGFSPDGARLLVAREARVAGRITRRFEVLATPTLAVEIHAGSADKLAAFKRWSAPTWRAATLALR